jgi:phosphate transport system permease protein
VTEFDRPEIAADIHAVYEHPTVPTEVINLTEPGSPRGDRLQPDLPETAPLLFRVQGVLDAELLSALLVGLAPVIILRDVLNWRGYLGSGVWWYLFFLFTYFLLQRRRASREIAVDRVVTALIWSASALIVGVLGWMIGFVVVRGLPRLGLSFFVHDMTKVGPLDPGGGVKAAIVGSAEQVGLAVAVVVPIAVLTAIYLHEMKGRLASIVRFVVNALAGLPSIVAGLLVYSAWVASGHGFSGVAGSASLVVLMLPVVTRTSEEVLRTVPDSLREASLALGAPQWKVVQKVVVPTARAGLTTAVILGTALGAGETAPLLPTTSYATNTVTNPFHGPQGSLPFYIYTYVLQPVSRQNQRGFTAAVVLLTLIMALFVLARLVGARSARRLGRR